MYCGNVLFIILLLLIIFYERLKYIPIVDRTIERHVDCVPHTET